MTSTASKMTRDRRRRERGFTLLELLIAMTLLGLVMVLLFSGMRLGTRAWQTNDQRIEEISRLHVVHGLLRRLLGQAFPMVPPGTMSAERLVFTGTPESLVFVGFSPAQLGARGFHLFDLRMADGPDGHRLVMNWGRFPFDAEPIPDQADGDETILVDDIAGFEVSYFGSDEPGEASRWRDTWSDAVTLPLLVRLRVEFAAGDRRHWPELVVAPMLSEFIPGQL